MLLQHLGLGLEQRRASSRRIGHRALVAEVCAQDALACLESFRVRLHWIPSLADPAPAQLTAPIGPFQSIPHTALHRCPTQTSAPLLPRLLPAASDARIAFHTPSVPVALRGKPAPPRAPCPSLAAWLHRRAAEASTAALRERFTPAMTWSDELGNAQLPAPCPT